MTDQDAQVHETITQLIAEEHRLRAEGASPEHQAQLQQLEVQLDQAWDLLRQRRARSEAGEDTADAHERPANEVEGYLQ